jgi:hypothetical protein
MGEMIRSSLANGWIRFGASFHTRSQSAPGQDPATPNDDRTVSYEDEHISDRSRNLSGSVYRWAGTTDSRVSHVF